MLPLSLLTVAILIQCHCVESLCSNSEENTCLSLSLDLVDSLQVEELQAGALLPSFQQHVHAVGCIMFIPNVSLAQCSESEIRQAYYSYDFGDGDMIKNSTEPNITYCYNESGVYNYSLNAIAVMVNSTLCFHANLSDYITLLDEVSNIKIVVSSDNSVRVDTKEPVTISAVGSLPITVYWNITQGNQSMQIIENHVEHSFQSHFNLTLPSDQMMMTFSETGQFAFVALFQNDISSKSGIFRYTVTSGPSLTLAAVVVVPGVILVLVALLIFAYYRTKKKRDQQIETASFDFVDLNDERSWWQRAKVTARMVADKVRRPSKTQKVGLVNLADSQQSPDDLYGAVSASIQ